MSAIRFAFELIGVFCVSCTAIVLICGWVTAKTVQSNEKDLNHD